MHFQTSAPSMSRTTRGWGEMNLFKPQSRREILEHTFCGDRNLSLQGKAQAGRESSDA